MPGGRRTTKRGELSRSPAFVMARGLSRPLTPNKGVGRLVGGLPVGGAGPAGTLYEGYTMSWGDEFQTLDIVGPVAPAGKWFTTRQYTNGGGASRGQDSALGTMYDADPLMTGHADSNRGVPVATFSDTLAVSGSVLALRTRKAVGSESTIAVRTDRNINNNLRNEMASMVSGMGAVGWWIDAAGTGDIIWESRIKMSAAAGNPAGWHPTKWVAATNPGFPANCNEFDWEGNSQASWMHYTILADGVTSGGEDIPSRTHDDTWYLVTFIFNRTNARLFINGTLFATASVDANSRQRMHYPIFSSHVYNAGFHGESYSKAAWDADADGAVLSVDWTRVWRRSAQAHYRPLQTVADQNVDYGGTVVITLPSVTALWGDAGVTEYVRCLPHEENEPGMSHELGYVQFPTGVSYNSGTREITVNITSGNTGRLHFAVFAWKTTGTTCEPLRFVVNVGPRLATPAIEFRSGQTVSYDLYVVCDCGVLTTNGSAKAKTISVAGLSGSGLSYSDSTGLLTGTAVAGTYNLTITITNSLGQSVAAPVTMTVAAAGAVDNFSGPITRLLNAHNSDSNHTWPVHPSSSNYPNTNPPRLNGNSGLYCPYGTSAGTRLFYLNRTPASADYDVSSKIKCLTVIAGDIIGIVGRCDTTATTFYTARYNRDLGAIQLFKFVAGSSTQLGTDYAITWAAGETKTLTLSMVGTTIAVKVDGSTVISVTDSAISAVGRGGIRDLRATANTVYTGMHWEDFRMSA